MGDQAYPDPSLYSKEVLKEVLPQMGKARDNASVGDTGVVHPRTTLPSQTSHFERNRALPGFADVARARVSTWRRKAAIVVAGALAVGMGYGVVFGHNGLTVYARKRQEEHSLRSQMQQLEHDNARLRGHVDRLQNDPSAIEHQAREELHYTRADEVIYTLPAPVSDRPSAVPND